MNKLLKTLIAIMTMNTAHAADELIVGCKPWDANLAGVPDMEEKHFVDFHIADNEGPEVLPENFHHCDLNDTGIFGAGNFSDFAAANAGRFNRITIDWGTYQHIHNAAAWANFHSLLSEGGSLIIPAVSYSVNPHIKSSAECLADRLAALTLNITTAGFSTVETHTTDALFEEIESPLIWRKQDLINGDGAKAIIVTTKL